jgi:hypothetical protein
MFTHVSNDTHNTVLCQKKSLSSTCSWFLSSLSPPIFQFSLSWILFMLFLPLSFLYELFLTLKKKMQCCYNLYLSQVDNVIFIPLFTIMYCYKFGAFFFFVLVNLFVIFFHFFYSLIQKCYSFRVMLLIWCFLCESVFLFGCVCFSIRLCIFF